MTEPMLLDRPLPEFDATRVEHRVIDGDLATVYEARTQATDDVARRGFLRYWRPLSPFIGVVMRSQLRVVADSAAAALGG